MSQHRNYKHTGAIVLGMHDALVSLTGLIAGLAFALADRYSIILSSIIASVAASLSMAASNYLAEKTNENPYAIIAAICTGTAYMITCVLLILPFFVITDRSTAVQSSFIIAFLIIFLFNLFTSKINRTPFWRRFLEMLAICVCVSVASFIIGQGAKYLIGIEI